MFLEKFPYRVKFYTKEDLSLLDLSPLQHEHAFGIMVIGAIEDIPLNPV